MVDNADEQQIVEYSTFDKVKHGLYKVEPIVLICFDMAATYAAFFLAAWGRNSWEGAFAQVPALFVIGVAALINLAIFLAANLYNSLWRYASVVEMLRVVLALLAGTIAGDIVIAVVFRAVFSAREYVLEYIVLLSFVAGIRLVIRIAIGSHAWKFGRRGISAGAPRSLIVGAGQTGSLTIKRMLAGDRDMAGVPVAVVDDDPTKWGMRINGVKVTSGCEGIPELAKRSGAEQIVVAIPSMLKTERDRVYSICMSTGLKVLTLPNIRDIPVDGSSKVALREVEVSDLLARDEVALDTNLVSGYVTGKTVLVTGGGGSIGSELVRQLLPAKPATIILYDIYENTVYELYHDIVQPARELGIKICTEIGSITHLESIEGVFKEYRPNVVFHAAAHKHVPLMEHNAREAIENNVFGTLNVVKLADKYGVDHFVLISTDKAVNPTNVMGATKRLCEMIVQHYAQRSNTVFAAVRFGNVLGSHGSVIPLFRRQLAEGGPITLTHKDITRYFMTIPEASRLVITAGALAKGGEIFVLKMGDPVKIYDLAVNLITLSGLKPGRDIEIKITGLRPGEKLYEELLMDSESVLPTENKDITVSVGTPLPSERLMSMLDELRESLDQSTPDIKRVIADVVPTYTPDLEDN